jgi:hypothetical protein
VRYRLIATWDRFGEGALRRGLPQGRLVPEQVMLLLPRSSVWPGRTR